MNGGAVATLKGLRHNVSKDDRSPQKHAEVSRQEMRQKVETE
jgi:hypothetical protein